jgi:phenylacetyl-CoA:acceptor oxidoreductase 26-kDa subunit
VSGRTRDVPFGPAPWHQTSWDWRAAGNFIGGGAGSGLIAFTVLAPAGAGARTGLLIAGLALVGLGLLCVALELGRPLRSLNVVRNPATSWMSREAMCAGALALAAIGAIAGIEAGRWLALPLALAFLYCQARLLQGGKGVPAWRERLVVPLLVSTGLAEGGGAFWLLAPIHRAGTLWLLGLFAVALVARWAIFRAYRGRVEPSLAPGARIALDRAGRVLHYTGLWAPFALALAAAVTPGPLAAALAALAGILSVVAGAWTKLALVTQAGYNQGFALPQMPVRGARP